MHNSSIEISNYPRRSKGGTHSQGSHRSDCRQNEDDADEQGPETSPCVDEEAELSHMPWTWLEFAENKLAKDGNAVTPIKSDGTDIENTSNSSV